MLAGLCSFDSAFIVFAKFEEVLLERLLLTQLVLDPGVGEPELLERFLVDLFDAELVVFVVDEV